MTDAERAALERKISEMREHADSCAGWEVDLTDSGSGRMVIDEKRCSCHALVVATLQQRIAELEQQKVFEAAFADKLKEFGTVDRLIESYSAAKQEVREVQARIVELERELADMNATFELQWAADMRAVQEWRKEDPEGRALMLPDRKDQFLWLCRKAVTLTAALKTAREALEKAFKLPRPWIDGGVTWEEWSRAFEIVQAALHAIDKAGE